MPLRVVRGIPGTTLDGPLWILPGSVGVWQRARRNLKREPILVPILGIHGLGGDYHAKSHTENMRLP